MTEERLQNILAARGIASRRRSGELIRDGRVEVDGKVVREKGRKFDPDERDIRVNGQSIPARSRLRYFLLNKPVGVISTAKDTHGRRAVTDLIDEEGRFYPAGRLDKETTGLVFITNDGELANRVMHPSYGMDKEYVADVRPPLKKKAMESFRGGLELDGKRTAECRIETLSKRDGTARYRIVIHEGRKRQIRRMFWALGSRVIRLERTRIGPLRLGVLKEGHYRPLSQAELRRLRSFLKERGADETRDAAY